MGSGGSIDPHFCKWGVKDYLLTPTFNVYKACFFAAFVSLSYTINTIHCVHPLRTQNLNVYVLQSLYRRAVILWISDLRRLKKIHQVNNVRKPSYALWTLTICSSRLNERRDDAGGDLLPHPLQPRLWEVLGRQAPPFVIAPVWPTPHFQIPSAVYAQRYLRLCKSLQWGKTGIFDTWIFASVVLMLYAYTV